MKRVLLIFVLALLMPPPLVAQQAPSSRARTPANDNTLLDKSYLDGVLAHKAPLASPTLTGTPTAPTASVGTNTTQIATTAFVAASIAATTARATGWPFQASSPGSSGSSATPVSGIKVDAITGNGPFMTPFALRIAADDVDLGVVATNTDARGHANRLNIDATSTPYFFRTAGAFGVEHTVGGPNVTGSRVANWTRLFVGTGSASNVNRNYVAQGGSVIISAPDGGSGPGGTGDGCVSQGGTNWCGAYFGTWPYVLAKSGAKYLMDVAGIQADVGLQTGSSSRIRRGVLANSMQQIQGTYLDAAFTVGSSPGQVQWKDGFVITDFNGQAGIGTSGSLLAVRNHEGAVTNHAWGFDLSQATFNQGILRSGRVTLTNNYLAIEDVNGTLELGSSTAKGASKIDFHSSAERDYGVRLESQGGNGADGNATLRISAANLALAGPTGTCTRTPGISSERVTCLSDERLKRDIVAARSTLDELSALPIKEFTVTADGSRRLGVVAQELQKVRPDLVRKDSEGNYMADLPGLWELTRAIQELKAVNDKLTFELRAVELIAALALGGLLLYSRRSRRGHLEPTH